MRQFNQGVSIVIDNDADGQIELTIEVLYKVFINPQKLRSSFMVNNLRRDFRRTKAFTDLAECVWHVHSLHEIVYMCILYQLFCAMQVILSGKVEKKVVVAIYPEVSYETWGAVSCANTRSYACTAFAPSRSAIRRYAARR